MPSKFSATDTKSSHPKRKVLSQPANKESTTTQTKSSFHKLMKNQHKPIRTSSTLNGNSSAEPSQTIPYRCNAFYRESGTSTSSTKAVSAPHSISTTPKKRHLRKKSDRQSASSDSREVDKELVRNCSLEAVQKLLTAVEENNIKLMDSSSIMNSVELELIIQLISLLAQQLNSQQRKQLCDKILTRICVAQDQNDVSIEQRHPNSDSVSSSAEKMSCVTFEIEKHSTAKGKLQKMHLTTTESTISKISSSPSKQKYKKNRKTENSRHSLVTDISIQSNEKTRESTDPEDKADDESQRIKVIYRKKRCTKNLTESTGSQIKIQNNIEPASKSKSVLTLNGTKKSTTTSSSKAVSPIKQKEKIESKNTKKSAMDEWLSPITKSEIEYEADIRKTMTIPTKSKSLSAQTSSELEINERLKWIQNEINRLKILRKEIIDKNNMVFEKFLYSSSKSSTERTSSSKVGVGTQTSSIIHSSDNIESDIQDTVLTPKSAEDQFTSSSATKSTPSNDMHFTKQEEHSKTTSENSCQSTEDEDDVSVSQYALHRTYEFLALYGNKKALKKWKKEHKKCQCNNIQPTKSSDRFTSTPIFEADSTAQSSQNAMQRKTALLTQPAEDFTPFSNSSTVTCLATRTAAIESNTVTSSSDFCTDDNNNVLQQLDSSATLSCIQEEFEVCVGSNISSSMLTSLATSIAARIHKRTSESKQETIVGLPHKLPKAIAYSIYFNKLKENKQQNDDSNSNASIASLDSNEVKLTLQEQFERARPHLLKRSQKRQAIVQQIQAMRLARGRELRRIIQRAHDTSLDNHLNELPPPAIKRIRIFSTKQMKSLNKKSVQNLSENVAKKLKEQEARWRHGNRVIKQLFCQRLQQRVHDGKPSLNHSLLVI